MLETKIHVRRATAEDAARVAPLFDSYRQFYGHPADLDLARNFIGDRLAEGSSILFVAEQEGEAVGFVQLYPSFSSMSAGPAMILNDLYVTPPAWGQGIAERLVRAAAREAAEAGAVKMSLMTQKTNLRARALYERLGWIADDEFMTYDLAIRR